MKVELCAASIEAIQLAADLKFDSIELCQDLEQGGVTPSMGMIRYALKHLDKVNVLIRPRAGGFHYSKEEFEVMRHDIISCAEMGVHGIVVGALNESGGPDLQFLEQVKENCGKMNVTFHRAFDDCIEWEKALKQLMDYKIDRVLTSGLARTAEIGIPILQRMKRLTENNIELVVGGGINAVNAPRIKQEVAPHVMHFSGTIKHHQDEGSLFSESVLKVDEGRVKRILEAIR